MIFGFYRLYKMCMKYNFSFVLDSEGYKCNYIKMILKPDEDKKYHIIIIKKGYKELFKEAVLKIERYRKVNCF